MNENASGESLYNGIELPASWPPGGLDENAHEPLPVPYLEDPPAAIPINFHLQTGKLFSFWVTDDPGGGELRVRGCRGAGFYPGEGFAEMIPIQKRRLKENGT